MTTMQPSKDDSTILLPVTFDYNGGHKESTISKVIATFAVLFIDVILTIAFIRADATFTRKLIFIVLVNAGFLYLLRFGVYKESKYSDAYEKLKEHDFMPPVTTFWGIYDVDSMYPYIVRFRNQAKGIYVLFEKSVIVGKTSDIMFQHYEAISDAYNVAAISDVNIAHLDYMDNVGNDSRMDGLYGSLMNCQNEDLKNLMWQIYGNLQFEMSQDYASYDVYRFTSFSNDQRFWYNVREILSKFDKGNYLSYKVLDMEGIRKICMATFNLKEFSAIDACNKTFASSDYKGVTPILLYSGDEEIKINDTVAEKREKAKQQEEAEEREYQESQERKLQRRKNLVNDLKKGVKKGSTSRGNTKKQGTSRKQGTNSNRGSSSKQGTRVQKTSGQRPKQGTQGTRTPKPRQGTRSPQSRNRGSNYNNRKV